MRLVLIEWVDSLGPGGAWGELTDLSPELAVVRSVGWLLHDTDTCKVLVPHLIDADPHARAKRQGCGDMTIPTAAIVRLIDLAEPDPHTGWTTIATRVPQQVAGEPP